MATKNLEQWIHYLDNTLDFIELEPRVGERAFFRALNILGRGDIDDFDEANIFAIKYKLRYGERWPKEDTVF